MTLHDYQLEDIARMVAQRHILNANRMGYGKTVETIMALKQAGCRNALIVAPKAVLHQWEAEFDKWWTGHPPIHIRSLPNILDRNVIVLTNYEQLLGAQMLQRYKFRTWDAVVLDESHRIKNRKSKTFTAVCQLPALRRICLTGTPILNRPNDLWSQLFWIDPKYFGKSYWKFISKYFIVEEGYFGKEIGSLKPDTLEEFNAIVQQATILHPDLQLTQGKQIIKVPLEMEKDQAKLYKDTRKLIFDSLPEELTISNALTHFLRLRQITSSPEQYAPESSNTKLEWLKAMIADNPDEKWVVYTNWEKTTQAFLKGLGGASLYTGSLGLQDRQTSLQHFRQGRTKVLLGTIKALGVGVDGLQHACRNVVFIDRDFSPEINAQAEDRVNRQGQTQRVNVYYLECMNTVDQRVDKINLSKAEDIKEAMR